MPCASRLSLRRILSEMSAIFLTMDLNPGQVRGIDLILGDSLKDVQIDSLLNIHVLIVVGREDAVDPFEAQRVPTKTSRMRTVESRLRISHDRFTQNGWNAFQCIQRRLIPLYHLLDSPLPHPLVILNLLGQQRCVRENRLLTGKRDARASI